MNTKMTLLAALLAATALAPAAAVAQNRHDRGDRARHERSDHARERSQQARHEARTVRADRPERVMPARAPRTITPPRSTAPRSHVTVRSASEARAMSATDRYNAARAQRQNHDRRTWNRGRSDNDRHDWSRDRSRGNDRRDHDHDNRSWDYNRSGHDWSRINDDRNRDRHDWDRNDHDWRGDRDDRYDRYRQAQRRYQNRVDQARDRYDFHDRARWNRDWRSNHRYDWRDYRTRNRHIYRLPRYYAPRGYDYGYHRFSIGLTIGSILYQDQYWINDPGYYRLPPAYGPYRWVRYYNDALLVDIRSGMVVDVIYDIFW